MGGHRRTQRGIRGQDAMIAVTVLAWWRERVASRSKNSMGVRDSTVCPGRWGLGELIDQTLHPRRGMQGPSLSPARGRLRSEPPLARKDRAGTIP